MGCFYFQFSKILRIFHIFCKLYLEKQALPLEYSYLPIKNSYVPNNNYFPAFFIFGKEAHNYCMTTFGQNGAKIFASMGRGLMLDFFVNFHNFLQKGQIY